MFRAIYSKVLFLDMRPENGEYELLLGYIMLEQCGAAVDVSGHRWIPAKSRHTQRIFPGSWSWCDWVLLVPVKYMDVRFFSSELRLLIVQPLIGAAAGGKPIFQLFLQRFDDCWLFGGEVD